MKSNRITLKDIAIACGYSANTVSRALRDDRRLSDATRSLIRETADRMGYIPNTMASSLRSGRSRMIAVIVNDLHNQHYCDLINRMDRELRAQGYTLMILCMQLEDELAEKLIHTAISLSVDGILYFPSFGQRHYIEYMTANRMPFVLLDRRVRGIDTRYSRDKVESARNFANKVWNASRFVLMNVSERKEFDPSKLETADKWILSRLQEAIRDVSDHMEDGDFGLAATKIYDFAWGEFCDWYIELSKSRLLGEDGESKDTVKAVLLYVLENLLKLLHPFMPFLTEQVYKYLPDTEGFLMLQKWPEYCEGFLFSEDEQKMQGIMEIIRTIRNLRSEMNVAPSKRTRLMLLAADGWKDTLTGGDGYFRRLAGASETVMLNNRNEVKEKTVSAVTAAGELFIPLGDLVDFEKEIARLGKELENLQKEMNRSRGMLNNQGFIAKAPAQLVQQERDKLEAAEAKAKALENRIAELKENA